jgi:hypothetical protein
LENHEILPRKQWLENTDIAAEELIDFDFLEQCISVQHEFDDCRIETLIGQPLLQKTLSFFNTFKAIQRKSRQGFRR